MAKTSRVELLCEEIQVGRCQSGGASFGGRSADVLFIHNSAERYKVAASRATCLMRPSVLS